MVSGFAKFKERLQGFENQYVIIGGAASDVYKRQVGQRVI